MTMIALILRGLQFLNLFQDLCKEFKRFPSLEFLIVIQFNIKFRLCVYPQKRNVCLEVQSHIFSLLVGNVAIYWYTVKHTRVALPVDFTSIDLLEDQLEKREDIHCQESWTWNYLIICKNFCDTHTHTHEIIAVNVFNLNLKISR